MLKLVINLGTADGKRLGLPGGVEGDLCDPAPSAAAELLARGWAVEADGPAVGTDTDTDTDTDPEAAAEAAAPRRRRPRS